MDPTTCWHDICEIVDAHNTDDADILTSRLRDLADWLESGGSFPDVEES